MDPRMNLENYNYINSVLKSAIYTFFTYPNFYQQFTKIKEDNNLEFLDPDVLEFVFNVKTTFGEIRVVVYRKISISTTKSIIFYYHGGGFKTLSVECFRATLQKIAKESNSVIICTENSKTPAARCSQIKSECSQIINYFLQDLFLIFPELPPNVCFGVMGDSAGGNLAVSMCVEFKHVFKFQILIYPWLDLTVSSPYVKEFGSFKYYLDRLGMKKFAKDFVDRGTSPADPRNSPLFISSKEIKDLPKTIIICGELDPLLGDSIEFDKKIKNENGDCELFILKGCVHGFFGAVKYCPKTCEKSVELVLNFIKRLTIY